MKWLRWLTTTVRVPVVLLALVLIMGAGALLASYLQNGAFQAGQRHTQVQQQKQGELIERKLCQTFGELAANKPPAGNPLTNPSRAFDQKQHAILVGLGVDLGCR